MDGVAGNRRTGENIANQIDEIAQLFTICFVKIITGGYVGATVTDKIFTTQDGREFQEVGRLPAPTGGHCVVALGQASSRAGRGFAGESRVGGLFVDGGYDQSGTAKFGAYISTMDRAGLIDRE